MWPTELYWVSQLLTVEPPTAVGSLTRLTEITDSLYGLGGTTRGVITVALALTLACLTIGLLTTHAVEMISLCRQSPVISFCIGLPAVAVVGGLTATGYVISTTGVGMAFGIPLVLGGVTLLPIWITVGLVAIGRVLAGQVGIDNWVAGVCIGGFVGGLAALTVPSLISIFVLAGAIGAGASIRRLLTGASTTQPSDRVVPPANKI